ncbi:hypothetical protein QBC47DRAFT_384386 [Echria macrotheca]|uniref:Uncharacterized protein n=1 Tax=Echria macrotheca TaxID=438768 RepID=A0AAJ0BAQ8_9PEZI|nr:hypothetical protein QBC47DRAFT_384386 [Echria macrotheca]
MTTSSLLSNTGTMLKDEDMADTPGLDSASPFSSTLSALSSPHKELPQTPQQTKARQQHARRPYQQHTRSPSLPLSLHHVGIGTPSPLLRQLSQFPSLSPRSPNALGILSPDADDELSSPDANPSPGSATSLDREREPAWDDYDGVDDVTQDRKDILVERLGDLMRRLQRVPSAEALDALHRKVDEMEDVLGREGVQRRPPLVYGADHTAESVARMAGLLRSGVSGERTVSRPGTSTEKEHGEPGGLEVAQRVLAEAESLNAQLVKTLQSLRVRKEESDHIHALLVERAEAAAARIIELEMEVADLEDELGGNESDLRHLRIELRAVETLCHESVQSGADPELVTSIQNWKADWARLREKVSASKKSRRARYHHPRGGEDGGDSTILMSSIASLSTPGKSPGGFYE